MTSKKSGRGQREPGNTKGLYAKNFPASVRDKVDIDYGHKLTPEQRQWLATVLDATVGADTKAMDELDLPTSLRRELYREKNVANRDLYAYAKGRKLLASDPPEIADSPERDTEESPAYLDSMEYKAALRKYREALDSKDAKAIAKAAKRLAAVNKA